METFKSQLALGGTTNRINQLAHVSLLDGRDNTSIGLNTQYAHGSKNTVVGAYASTGSDRHTADSVMIGYRSGANIKYATQSVAIGSQAASRAQNLQNTILVGTDAGKNIVSAAYCTALGFSAAAYMIGGVRNTMVGSRSGMYAVNTIDNTFVGDSSGITCTNGQYNVCVGSACGSSLVAGDQNVFIGYQAGSNVSHSNDNVAIGASAMETADGQWNMAVGTYAGRKLTGSYNTILGSNTCTNVEANFTTVIGNQLVVATDGSLVRVANSIIIGQNIQFKPKSNIVNTIIIGSQLTDLKAIGEEYNDGFLFNPAGSNNPIMALGANTDGLFIYNNASVTVYQPSEIVTANITANAYVSSPLYYVTVRQDGVPSSGDAALKQSIDDGLVISGPMGSNTVTIQSSLRLPTIASGNVLTLAANGSVQDANVQISTLPDVQTLSRGNLLFYADGFKSSNVTETYLTQVLGSCQNLYPGNLVFGSVAGTLESSTVTVATLNALVASGGTANITGAASTIVTANLSPSVVVVSNAAGKVVSSNISTAAFASLFSLTPNVVVVSDSSGKVAASSVTVATLNALVASGGSQTSVSTTDLLVANLNANASVIMRTSANGTFDAPANSHSISIQNAILGGSDFNNIMGTLIVSATNQFSNTHAKLGHGTMSVLMATGSSEMDIMPVSMHSSLNLSKFTVGKTSDNGNIVIQTDSDCSITWQFYGSAFSTTGPSSNVTPYTSLAGVDILAYNIVAKTLFVGNLAAPSSIIVRACPNGSFDLAANAHYISVVNDILTGSAYNNLTGTLYVSVTNQFSNAHVKVAQGMLSVMKAAGSAEMDIMPLAMHLSANTSTFTVGKTADNGSVVINTDADCSISWQFFGSGF